MWLHLLLQEKEIVQMSMQHSWNSRLPVNIYLFIVVEDLRFW